MVDWRYHPVIAAVRDEQGVRAAAQLAGRRAVFLLGGDIQSLGASIDALHATDKAVYVHIDLVEGLGKDAAGIRYLADLGAQGAISTRAPLMRACAQMGMEPIQRIFLIDAGSLQSGIRLLADSRAAFCEVMPGVVYKAILSLSSGIGQRVIAGGMVTTEQEVRQALQAGAVAVSTSATQLWDMQV